MTKISFNGHTGAVHAVAVTPDSRQVVSGSLDKTLKIWNIENGQLLRTLVGHMELVDAVAVTPNGRQVVSGSNDKTLKVWDLESGQLLCTLEGHTKSVNAVAVTPDGRQVVSGSLDKTLKIWNLENGQLLRSLKGNAGHVSAVAVTPDGAKVVSSQSDYGTPKVWNLASSRMLRSLEGNTGPQYTSVAVTPDGRKVVSGSGDKTLNVWDLESGQLMPAPTSVYPAGSFEEFARQASQSSSSITIRMSEVKRLMDVLIDALIKAYSNLGPLEALSHVRGGLLLRCPNCGQLSESAVSVLYLAGTGIMQRSSFAGPNVAALAQSNCPSCGGDTVIATFNPQKIKY